MEEQTPFWDERGRCAVSSYKYKPSEFCLLSWTQASWRTCINNLLLIWLFFLPSRRVTCSNPQLFVHLDLELHLTAFHMYGLFGSRLVIVFNLFCIFHIMYSMNKLYLSIVIMYIFTFFFLFLIYVFLHSAETIWDQLSISNHVFKSLLTAIATCRSFSSHFLIWYLDAFFGFEHQ